MDLNHRPQHYECDNTAFYFNHLHPYLSVLYTHIVNYLLYFVYFVLKSDGDDVQFRFLPSPEKIWVAIRNKTDHSINLVRDQAEFIDHLGKSHKVVYGHNFESEISLYADNYVPPMRIDSGSEITGNAWINIWLDYSIMKDSRSNRSDINYFMQPFFYKI